MVDEWETMIIWGGIWKKHKTQKEKEELTEIQKRIINLRNEYGLNEVNIGKVMGITQPSVNSHLKACKNKGFIVNRSKRDQGELPLSDTEKIREELKTRFKGL